MALHYSHVEWPPPVPAQNPEAQVGSGVARALGLRSCLKKLFEAEDYMNGLLPSFGVAT